MSRIHIKMYFGPYMIKANLFCHSHHTPRLIAVQEKKITKISIYLFHHNSLLPSSPMPVFQLSNYASILTLLESGSVPVINSGNNCWTFLTCLLLLRLNYFEISAFSYFSSPRLPYEGCCFGFLVFTFYTDKQCEHIQ